MKVRNLFAFLIVAFLASALWGGPAFPQGNEVVMREPIDLGCGEILEVEVEFGGGWQVIAYPVFLPPGATLQVYVKDGGQRGDIWRACIAPYNTTYESSPNALIPEARNCTQGDGGFYYSRPASLTLPGGRAYVTVRYVQGIDVWPAHMYVRFECVCEGGGAAAAVETVIAQILYGDVAGKAVYVYPQPLAPGQEVENWAGQTLRVPTETEWYVFVDDHYGANFEHACRHVFVSTSTGNINEVVPATTPPRYLELELARGGTARATPSHPQVSTTWATYTQPPGGPQPPTPPPPPDQPGSPDSEQPPPGEENDLQNLIGPMPQPSGLYVHYMGSWTTVGATNLGGHLKVAANMPSSGMLWVFEYYQSSGNWAWYMWPASAGWKYLWFTGDAAGWHSIIAYAGGTWTNWIHIFVTGGATAGCSVSPTSLNFGTVAPGSSATQTFVIKNTGSGILSGTVSESCPDFSVSPSSYSLMPGATKTFTVTFSPTSQGSKSCMISTSSPCANVNCSGSGGPPPQVPKKYAILLSGGVDASYNYPRYLKDLTFMRSTLISKYGYTDANIYVLYADGTGPSWVDYSATKANLLMVFNILQSTMSGNDELFVFVTNHGGQITSGTNQAKIWLWNYEWIADWEFASKVDALPAQAQKYFLFEQCYGGGMIDNLAGPNRSIATAASWNEPSWACDGSGDYGHSALEYDEFSLHWTQRMNSSPGSTLKQAFNYANSADSSSETPQYSDPSGIGFTTGL